MKLDFSQLWHIIGPREPEPGSSAAFAAFELAAVLGRMDCQASVSADDSRAERIFVLDAGSRDGDTRPGRFSWRACEGRVEVYGDCGASLLRGVYDFLEALGARWPGPGADGERLPAGPILDLETESRTSSDEAMPTTLVLAHGAYLERFADYLAWAPRVGYSSVLIRTTRAELALEAAPEALYESLRDDIAALALKLGLSLELAYSCLDGEPCPMEADDLGRAAEAFAALAAAHPEAKVFHLWPEELPINRDPKLSRPPNAPFPSARQSLPIARALAAALGRVRPDARLSLLVRGDEGLAEAVRGGGELSPGLELLWAPRERSYGHALGDTGSSLNASSLAAFRLATGAWRSAGGGRVVALERYEDAFLFKGAVPPLASVIEGDLAAYRGAGADAIGSVLCGGRLPLAPRPNLALLPRLAAARGLSAESALADWSAAAYRGEDGDAGDSGPMLEYWRELEAAWAVDLAVEEGETAVHAPSSLAEGAKDPPADWGDPWKAGAARLEAKRGRCEELFDHLRRAEAKLGESRREPRVEGGNRAARAEAAEYAISGSVLELSCARLSAYHELVSGNAAAAADIANLALSASAAVRKALASLPDPRSRREMRLLIALFYDQRLRLIRRANARSGLRRLVDLWYTSLRAELSARSVGRAYEPEGKRSRGLAPREPRH